MDRRYLLFSYYGYYPGGGWTDFRSSHITLEEAIAEGKLYTEHDYVEIVDLDTNGVIMTKSEINA